jgi:hypothetical protein
VVLHDSLTPSSEQEHVSSASPSTANSATAATTYFARGRAHSLRDRGGEVLRRIRRSQRYLIFPIRKDAATRHQSLLCHGSSNEAIFASRFGATSSGLLGADLGNDRLGARLSGLPCLASVDVQLQLLENPDPPVIVEMCQSMIVLGEC